jgi:hypothetical protein
MSTIVTEIKGIDGVARELNAFPEQAERAEQRATRKTIKWAERMLRRELALAHEIPFKSIREARRVQSNRKAIWLGYDPVKAAYVGKLEQLEGGAMAGRYYFESAFMASLRSGHESIFKRRPHLDKHSRGRPTHWKPNLSVDEQEVALTKAEAVAAREAEKIESRFFQTLRQELNYEMNVRGSR